MAGADFGSMLFCWNFGWNRPFFPNVQASAFYPAVVQLCHSGCGRAGPQERRVLVDWRVPF